jgi:HAD superfamily hydrolase (TIGR01490 family)
VKLALFDLDHTLLPIDSDHAWGQFTLDIGWCDPGHFKARNDEFFAQYQAGALDVHAYVRFATEAIRLRGPQVAQAAREDFMRRIIGPALRPEALALVESHRAAGDQLVIVTATNEFITQPIAEAFGVRELVAVRLAGDNRGWITGEIDGVPSMREGKVTRMAQWLAERGLTWSDVDATFYSDSLNDLPLLEAVRHPVATNPDPRLRRIAAERGWRILDLFGPPTPAA